MRNSKLYAFLHLTWMSIYPLLYKHVDKRKRMQIHVFEKCILACSMSTCRTFHFWGVQIFFVYICIIHFTIFEKSFNFFVQCMCIYIFIFFFCLNCSVIDIFLLIHFFFNHYDHLCILHLFCLSAVPMADNKFLITSQSLLISLFFLSLVDYYACSVTLSIVNHLK